jgi:hypothetical protein
LNQQTSKSPFGHSTMLEAWLCQCSRGKINSDSKKGAAVFAFCDETRVVGDAAAMLIAASKQ